MLHPKYEIDQFDRKVLRGRSKDFYLFVRKHRGCTLRQIIKHFDMNERNLRRLQMKLLKNGLIKPRLIKGKSTHYYYVTKTRVNLIGV